MTTATAPLYRLYLRRDAEHCREMLATRDQQYALNALDGAVRTAEASGVPLQGWISADPDNGVAGRMCEEIARQQTIIVPRKPRRSR